MQWGISTVSHINIIELVRMFDGQTYKQSQSKRRQNNCDDESQTSRGLIIIIIRVDYRTRTRSSICVGSFVCSHTDPVRLGVSSSTPSIGPQFGRPLADSSLTSRSLTLAASAPAGNQLAPTSNKPPIGRDSGPRTPQAARKSRKTLNILRPRLGASNQTFASEFERAACTLRLRRDIYYSTSRA